MACLGYIAFQDFQERKVFWFLFPMAMILFGLVHFMTVEEHEIFLNYVSLNLLLVTLIIILLYGYSRFIAKDKFLNHSLGLGDILFFYAFATGFPTFTFIILFANAILFSLLSFLVLKKKFKQQTVPLAGFMGLFLVFMMCFELIFKSLSLYAY